MNLTENDHIFDGFCHRNFNPSIDGWRNAVPHKADYPAVQNALDVLAMFDEIGALRIKVWELEKENKHLKELRGY